MEKKLLILLVLLSLNSSLPAEEPVREVMRHAVQLDPVPFAEVVFQSSGKRVLPVDPASDADWILQIGRVADLTLQSLNHPEHPVQSLSRINEASRLVEEELLTRLNAIPGWSCSIPQTASGDRQTAGYPDLRISIPGRPTVYLDPKIHSRDASTSSLRTFYFEPKSSTLKITEDAHHLVLGISHSDKQFLNWQIVDLATLPVRLKAEFQSNNRDIYRKEAILLQSQPSAP